MNCPYCVEPVNDGATVCKTCQRDIALAMSLKEANHALEERIQEFEAELAGLREHGPGEAAPPVVEEPPPPPGIVDLVAVYLILPTLALVAAHYLIVVRFDAKLVWLRVASIALPTVMGVMLEHKLRPRWFITLGFGIVVGLASVFGMSAMVHFTDGDPVMPDSAVAWRETLEYATSIALAYLLGSLLAFAAQPARLTGKRDAGRIARLATFIARHLSGGNKKLPLEVRVQRVVTLIKIAASISTAVGALYTGLKGVL